MESLLKKLSFETIALIGCSAADINDKYKTFLLDEAIRISNLDSVYEYGQFFIYYSGHGRMIDGVTYAFN
jgi:hypothetical protein